MAEMKTWMSEETSLEVKDKKFRVVGHLFSASLKHIVVEEYKGAGQRSVAFGLDEEMPPIGTRVMFTYSQAVLEEVAE